MKYVVTRTSEWVEDNPKVKGVQKEILPYIYGSKDKIEELREAYTIEIDSLEVLHQFIKDCGCHIVVSNPSKQGYGFQLPEIEVYDTYRE
jgi:hypothetical protein